MKNIKLLSVICGLALLGASSLLGGDARNYQVTGPIVALTATTITVQKGDEKWEISRNKDTKITGDLKVGSKVTIYYEMVAAKIEVKETKEKK
jgi:hypothetical protein